eukprot:gene15636-21745_t
MQNMRILLPLLLVLLQGVTAQVSDPVECLREAWSNGRFPFKRIYSQYEEDGVIERIFDCIGTTTKTFVEFGVENGRENPAINLHKEWMDAETIVSLFEKYNVPKPVFDHLTTDIDLNTFHVLRAILAGGYRPRVVVTEVNRNLAPGDSYTVLYDPKGNWHTDGISCYFGASALAYARMMHHFGYSLVAVDVEVINLYFVHRENGLGGREPPFTYRQYEKGATLNLLTGHVPCN